LLEVNGEKRCCNGIAFFLAEIKVRIEVVGARFEFVGLKESDVRLK
jgi:hypothetical protein